MIEDKEIKSQNDNIIVDEVGLNTADSPFSEKDESLTGSNAVSTDSELVPPSDIGDEFLDEWDDETDEDDGLDGFELPDDFESENVDDNESSVQKSETEIDKEENIISESHSHDTVEPINNDINENTVAETVSDKIDEELNAQSTVEENSSDIQNKHKNENVDVPNGWATNETEEYIQNEEDDTDETYSELENVRDVTAEMDSELADLSYLGSIKKKETNQELSKDAKKKAQEEKKRKRKEENDLFARRYQAKTINAAVAQSNPIIYFYNAILNKSGEVKLFNVYQVLQDRFVGKLVPQLWTAVAESSDRILELNMANLVEQLKVCETYPMYEFVLTMSTRFFTKPAVLKKMLDLIEKPVPNLVMAFDCVSMQNLGVAAKTGLAQVKEKGVKVILDNTEKVSMTTLSELEFDYLRIDSRYYELGNFKSEGFLRLLSSWANELGIPTIAMYCDHNDMVEYMLYMGIDLVQGNSISRPMRTVPNAVKAITPSDSMINNDE